VHTIHKVRYKNDQVYFPQDTDEWFDDDFGLPKPTIDRNHEMQREDWANQLVSII